VAAVLKPSSDSQIEVEVWLPSENWNGKFEAVGNGGWAGAVSFAAMASALQEGYATASTDTGHKGGNAAFAIGHPEKVIDFAYRAVHEMTVTSQSLIAAFYDRAPRLSYWNGCSTGGRQGLMEAQRYPADFDGIIAGAPANYQTHLHAWDLGVSVHALKDQASLVSPAKAAALSKAVLNACDAHDGVKDGLINDPRACHVDLSTLLCRGADADNCLTAAQLDTVTRVYAPAKTKSGMAMSGKLVAPVYITIGTLESCPTPPVCTMATSATTASATAMGMPNRTSTITAPKRASISISGSALSPRREAPRWG